MLVSKEHHADLAPLTDLIDTVRLTSNINRTYPLSPLATRYVTSKHGRWPCLFRTES